MTAEAKASDGSSKPAWRHPIRVRIGPCLIAPLAAFRAWQPFVVARGRKNVSARSSSHGARNTSERRPWDRGPLATRPRQPPATEQQVRAVYQRCDLLITQQRAELVGCLLASLRTAASSRRFSSQPAHPHNNVRSL